MAKFTDPTGNGIIYISQTYHGEKTVVVDNQCAIDISMIGGETFHSVCDGVVELTTTSGGGYISIIPDNLNARVLYVHTTGWLVSKGQRVTAGQRLGLIQKIDGSHLHIGMKNKDNSTNPPRIMDYFDRGLRFDTKYEDIRTEWFRSGQLNWSLFQDLQYGPVSPSEAPELTEARKRIEELTAQNTKLLEEKKQAEKEYQELSDQYGTLMIQKNTCENDKINVVGELNAIKGGKWYWIVDMLEKLFPTK